MRIALIADVHSNLLALESVMKAIKRHRPDRIISLGDQVNLGPCPRQTLDLLHAEGVTCLHGNHERYILSAMRGDPGYAGANFDILRWDATQLSAGEITLPETLALDGVTLCHAIPGDDRFPVFDPEKALSLLEEKDFGGPMHIICGHGHNPTHIRYRDVVIDSIGSVGCMDDGVPGTAPFVILTLERGHAVLRPYYVAYDVKPMKSLFRQSGMADFCPTMARIACTQMMTNADYLLAFVNRALALSKSRGESAINHETWADTDAAFAWPDGQSTAQFWKDV